MDKKLYNLSSIEMISGGEDTFTERMINLFVELTPALLVRIKTGLNNQDYPEIKAASHKMISPIDMMQIESLRGTIREIENMAIERADITTIQNAVDFLELTLDQVILQLKNRD